MKEIEFEAQLGGDGECFCFSNIPKEDILKILGEEEYNDRVKEVMSYREEIEARTGIHDNSEVVLSRLYPTEVLIYALGCDMVNDRSRKYKIKIALEKVDE